MPHVCQVTGPEHVRLGFYPHGAPGSGEGDREVNSEGRMELGLCGLAERPLLLPAVVWPSSGSQRQPSPEE